MRVFLWLLLAVLAASPVQAMPAFARQFNVGCETCHTVPPRLNGFGQAFLANNFHAAGLTRRGTLPITLITEFGHKDNPDARGAKLRALEVIVADGFGGEGRGGSYLIVGQGTTAERRAGDLGEAFVSLPVAGSRGQWAITAGQAALLRNQWWHHAQLTKTAPAALSLARVKAAAPSPALSRHHEEDHSGRASPAGRPSAFSFDDHLPSIRLDFFSGRGSDSGRPDGDYLTLGVPFAGRLALNDGARLGGARGLFLHAFRHRGAGSLGGFGYSHAGAHLAGLIATHDPRPDLSLLGIASTGRDADGGTQRLAAQGDWIVNPAWALTARLEALAGKERAVGWLAAATYYPLPLSVLRLTLEASQVGGEPRYALTARGQF